MSQTTLPAAAASVPRPRVSAMPRATTDRLTATEYDRVLAALKQLAPGDWTRPTACPGWDVKALAGHMLGMAEFGGSVRENLRQFLAARRAGGVWIDALTALQVAEHASLTPAELVARFEAAAPRAVRGLRRVPGFIRRRRMPIEQPVGMETEPWTFGYTFETIAIRDNWMHRMDIAAATGAAPVLTAAHDGVLVADVAREWAGRHGKPCTLSLTGPAGGTFRFGTGGPSLELDAVDFCRVLSGRGTGSGLLAVPVPF